MTSRELVQKTLTFSCPERVPRVVGALPWAKIYYPTELQKIMRDFPNDTVSAPAFYKDSLPEKGNAYELGEYIDVWGCRFHNRQRGVHGEVKEPLILNENWEDADNVKFPLPFLSIDRDRINLFCSGTDKYVKMGFCPRPFERLQFLRGTENLYIDLAEKSPGMLKFVNKLHAFYCDIYELWADTNVDMMVFMDDWGSQKSLLINPDIWIEIFKPLYKDYIDIAHRHGKKAFMHSDGNILEIMPHLVELGLDTINAQIFCMGIQNLIPYKGQITFWGEIDRQHLLPFGSIHDIDNAVRNVKESLWHNGGCVAFCEFGAGARPENVYQVYQSWNEIL